METNTEFAFVGESAALDFINTEFIQKEERVELLVDFESLIEWLVQAELVEREEVTMRSLAWQDTSEMENTVVGARQLRHHLRALTEELAKDQPISPEKVESLNQQLQRYTGYLQVAIHADGVAEKFAGAIETPNDLLAPLAKEITTFLSEVDLSLIKQCGNPECIHFFHDTTRNHSRRWCSMERCGNRMKVAAYYDRKRKQKEQQ